MQSSLIMLAQFLLITCLTNILKTRYNSRPWSKINQTPVESLFWAKFEFSFDRSLTHFIYRTVVQTNFRPKPILKILKSYMTFLLSIFQVFLQIMQFWAVKRS